MPLGGRSRHGCCKIGTHQMIIVGGKNAERKYLSSGAIYDVRTEQWMLLPNDMPEDRSGCNVVNDGNYVYVIGGTGAHNSSVNTVFRLSLGTLKWNTMATMGTERSDFAAVLKGSYIYAFGGVGIKNSSSIFGAVLASVERYSIVDNSWVALPEMVKERAGHCAVTTAIGRVIYIVGGNSCSKACVEHMPSLERFDTVSLCWKSERNLIDMPECRSEAPTVMLGNRYLVAIGGFCKMGRAVASCLIFDCIFNRWASTPAPIDMSTARGFHTAVVLDGNIIVAGWHKEENVSYMELISTRDLLEFAPVIYPLPIFYYNRILQIGKPNDENI